jgi:hypothetical protein
MPSAWDNTAKQMRLFNTAEAERRSVMTEKLVTIMTGTKADCMRMSNGMAVCTVQPSPQNKERDPNGQWELLGPNGGAANGADSADEMQRLRDCVRTLQAERDDAVGVVSILYAALDDASHVVVAGEDEDCAYQADLEAGRALLDRMNHAAGPYEKRLNGGRTDACSAPSDLLAFVEKVSCLKKWGEMDDEGQPFEPSDGVDDSHSCLMDLIDEARGLLACQPQPIEPGNANDMSIARFMDVNLLDIIGDYITPDEVEEWRWIRSVASFAHRKNGEAPGVWEFLVNMAMPLDNIPPKLAPVIEAAQNRGAEYILFHQG